MAEIEGSLPEGLALEPIKLQRWHYDAVGLGIIESLAYTKIADLDKEPDTIRHALMVTRKVPPRDRAKRSRR